MPARTEPTWRSVVPAALVALAAAAGLAGCATVQPSAAPTSPAPTPSYSPGIGEACQEVANDIAAGKLRDAEGLLAGHPLTGADPTCADAATSLVAERRTQAAQLVEAARTSPARAALLAAAALRLDDGNAQARAIADVAPVTLPSSIPTPSLSLAPEHPASQATAADPCAPAREALSEGRFTEATELVAALGDGPKCADAMQAEIVEHQAAQPLQRVWRSLTDDRLWQLLLAATLVLLGAVLARVTTAGRRPSRLPNEGRSSALAAAFVAVGLLAPALAQFSPALVERLPGGPAGVWWDFATAVTALVFGYTVVRHLRATAPTMVEVVDSSGKSVDNSTFGTLVIREISTIAEESPGGVFAVTGGSDLADSGVTAVLDTVTQKYLKAAITVWRAVTTGLGDRVRVDLVGTESEPVAALVIRRGARSVYAERIDTRDLRVDKGQPSETEKASANHDLATAVAARVVLEYLGLVGKDVIEPEPSLPRLYGVSEPRSLAVAAVAARHSERGRYPEAVELFARAHGLDPQNMAARYGRAVNTLRTSAAGDDGRVALDDLEALSLALWPLGDHSAQSRTPLAWRCRYNVAVHRANRVLSGGIPEPGSGSMAQLARRCAEVSELIEDLRRPRWGTGDALPGDEGLASRLAALADTVVVGLAAALGEPAVSVRSRLEQLETAASLRATVNVANGYALLWKRSEDGAAPQDLSKAVDLMRLAGLEVRMRGDILADPVLSLLATTKPYRALVQGWGLDDAVAYAGVASIGPAARKLARWYPTPRRLYTALRRHPERVLPRGGAGPEQRDWWLGALDWLRSGRDVATINAYQAAGIRDAAQAQSLTDAGVVAALHRRRKDDPTLVVPDARVRALMAS